MDGAEGDGERVKERHVGIATAQDGRLRRQTDAVSPRTSDYSAVGRAYERLSSWTVEDLAEM